MGRIRLRSDSCIGVQPRTDLHRSKGRGQDKTRRDHGAGGRARRMRPIAILVEGLHPPNNSKIRSPEIRESRRVLTWPPSRRSKPHRTRLNGFAGRGDPRDQATGIGPWNPRPGRIATGIPRRTLQGERSSPYQVATHERPTGPTHPNPAGRRPRPVKWCTRVTWGRPRCLRVMRPR
jgi:hypothetical protein